MNEFYEIVSIESTEHFFEQIKTGNVIVDFNASWCKPCKEIIKNFKNIEKYPIKILKVDINEFDEISDKFNVGQIPHFVFFINGELQKEYITTSDISELESKIIEIFL